MVKLAPLNMKAKPTWRVPGEPPARSAPPSTALPGFGFGRAVCGFQHKASVKPKPSGNAWPKWP
eukprot:5152593-Alexandrium_andersonii.AAC.1